VVTQSESAILNKMERIVAIGEAADVLGVSIATLRRWEAAGKLAAEHMAGGHRRDDVAKLSYAPELFGDADAAVGHIATRSHGPEAKLHGR
jgi:excisionase family DNA binding protein